MQAAKFHQYQTFVQKMMCISARRTDFFYVYTLILSAMQTLTLHSIYFFRDKGAEGGSGQLPIYTSFGRPMRMDKPRIALEVVH